MFVGKEESTRRAKVCSWNLSATCTNIKTRDWLIACLQPVSRERQPHPSHLRLSRHMKMIAIKERRSCRSHRWNLHFNFPFLILTSGSDSESHFASVLEIVIVQTSWRLTNGKSMLAYLQSNRLVASLPRRRYPNKLSQALTSYHKPTLGDRVSSSSHLRREDSPTTCFLLSGSL